MKKQYIPDERDIYNACMYFRHDFGLCGPIEKEKIISQGKQWVSAWKKAVEVGIKSAIEKEGK